MTWLAEFAEWLEGQDMRENTVRAYRSDLKLYAEWYQARYRDAFAPEKLAAVDLRAYRKYLIEVQRAAPETVNRRITAQRTFNRWAFLTDRLQHAVASQVDYVQVPEPAPRWLTKRELNKLLAALEKEVNGEDRKRRPARYRQAVRMRAFFTLMYGCGLRIGEVGGLNREDLAISDRKGGVHIRNAKGRRFDQLPVGLEARKALAEWLSIRGDDPGPLFTSQKGGRLSRRPAQRYFQRMLRRADIEDARRPHDLRHTYIKRVVENENLAVARKLARHSSIEMTLRYAAPGQEDFERAAEGVFA